MIVTIVTGQAQTVNIPDTCFKALLIEQGVDSNNNGEIEYSEAEAVTELNLFSWAYTITDLAGIEAFVNLEVLYCVGFHTISIMDLSANENLEYLDCGGIQLDSLIVTNCIQLKEIVCYNNQLSFIDRSTRASLEELNCSDNIIDSFDLSSNHALKKIGLRI